MSELAKKTLETAISQIGVEEMPKGRNAGPEVEIYLKSVGLGQGYSWCMAFVYWCVNQSAVKTGFKNPLKKTGGVMDQYNSRPLLCTHLPQAGDVFIMDFGKGLGHTGIVEKVIEKTIYTIEGNTNDDGSREGYKVCRRKRNIKTIKAFIRL
ncbi:CHAP domain-containing protein [Flavobacterium psychrophilum]|uniref:CHAP domain-containing protein n=1 Tax=Flavobacterium psychrophilum TaxID=96345 RepID=UPI003139005C